MRLVLACIGRQKAGAERELVTRYLDRARAGGRQIGFTQVDMVEIGESTARRPEDRMAEEGAALVAAFPADAALVMLDPRGQNLSSEAFTGWIRERRDEGVPAICFVIGGADGLSGQVRSRATLLLAYGAATFPHQLVRVMAAEQLYRAVTILCGHPYHRA